MASFGRRPGSPASRPPPDRRYFSASRRESSAAPERNLRGSTGGLASNPCRPSSDFRGAFATAIRVTTGGFHTENTECTEYLAERKRREPCGPRPANFQLRFGLDLCGCFGGNGRAGLGGLI